MKGLKMNEITFLIIFFYYTMIGFFGGLALYLEYDNAWINLWKHLKKQYKIIGCLLIYLIIHPAILFTLIADIFWALTNIIIDIFWLIFKKGEWF